MPLPFGYLALFALGVAAAVGVASARKKKQAAAAVAAQVLAAAPPLPAPMSARPKPTVPDVWRFMSKLQPVKTERPKGRHVPSADPSLPTPAGEMKEPPTKFDF